MKSMQNKKAFRSGLLITTVILFMGGCGKQADPASAEQAETVKEFDTEEDMESTEVEDDSTLVETEKPDVMDEAAQTSESVSTSEPAETTAPVDAVVPVQTGKPTEAESLAQTEKSTKAERPAETVKPAVSAKLAATQTPAETAEPAVAEKQVESPETAPTETPAVNDSTNNQTPASQPEAPAQTPAPIQTPQPETPTQQPSPEQQPQPPAQPEQSQPPVHEHTWKEHYAETQTWIPNIVVVEDYGEIPGEQYGLCICNCGFETTDHDMQVAHMMAHIEAGESSQFTTQTLWTEPTWGVIGSHEEDQGYYETSTYVDYYYCDCGATK